MVKILNLAQYDSNISQSNYLNKLEHNPKVTLQQFLILFPLFLFKMAFGCEGEKCKPPRGIGEERNVGLMLVLRYALIDQTLKFVCHLLMVIAKTLKPVQHRHLRIQTPAINNQYSHTMHVGWITALHLLLMSDANKSLVYPILA